MKRFIILNTAFLIVLSSQIAAQERFARYQKIEGYEVRPGVLMIPSYTADNQICEIGIEKLRYSPNLVSGDLLSRAEIDSILDEVVPISERGAPSKDFPREMVSIQGRGAVSMKEYEKVSFQVYSTWPVTKRDRELNSNDLVAVVKWKNRTCK